MTAAELREQAAAKFKEANDLITGKAIDDLDAETETKFNTLMDEGKAIDQAFRTKAGTEGNAIQLKDSLDFYAGKITGKGIPWAQPVGIDLSRPTSMGEQFVQSEQYKALVGGSALASDKSSFKTDPFSPKLKAATDVIYSAAGGGGALVTPQYLPGVLPLPQRPLTVRDLFSQDTTQADTLSYARQTTFDSAAGPVAQATSLSTGLKPQSAIGWTRVTSPIEAIATWMAATRRQLADAGQTRSLIDNQLTLMLKLVEEDQYMNGNGSSPNLRGILNTTGVQTLDVSGVSGGHFTNVDAIRDAKRLIKTGPAFADASGVVMNPLDAAELDEGKDSIGRYLGQGPFGSANDSIWRMPRVESLAIPAGFALVGAFKQGATVFEREGIVILTADQHADFFIRNLVAVLAEERHGLAVFFPAAFCYVTLRAGAAGWTY